MAESKEKSVQKTVIYCGGSKGGCGKSLAAGSITDVLLEAGKQVTLLDCDKANADAKLWCGSPANSVQGGNQGGSQLLKCVLAPVTDEFDPLVDAICAAKSEIVVVNAGAGDVGLFVDSEVDVPMLSGAVNKYGWRFLLLYFLTPSIGSIRPLLPLAQASMSWAEIVVLRNLYFRIDHFKVWEELVDSTNPKQTIRSTVMKLGVKEENWPVLGPSVVLAAHSAGWTSLRHLEASAVGAVVFKVFDYRKGVRELLKGWKI